MPKYMHPSKKSRAIVIFSISASLLLHGIGIYFLFEHPFSLHSSHAIPFGSKKSYAKGEKSENKEKLETLRDAFNYIVAKNERKLPQNEVVIDPAKLVAPIGERLENATAIDSSLHQLSLALDREAKNSQLLLQGISTDSPIVLLKEQNVKALNINSLKPKSLLSINQIELEHAKNRRSNNQQENLLTSLKPSVCNSSLSVKPSEMPNLAPVSRPTHWTPLIVKSGNQIKNNEVIATDLTPKKAQTSCKIDLEIALPNEIPEPKSRGSEPNYRDLRNPKKEITGNLQKRNKPLLTPLPTPVKTSEKRFTLYGNNKTESAESERVTVGKKALDYAESLSLENEAYAAIARPANDAEITHSSSKQLHEKSALPTPKMRSYRYLATTEVPSYTHHFTHSLPVSIQYSAEPLTPQEKVPFSADPIIAFSEKLMAMSNRSDNDSPFANSFASQNEKENQPNEQKVECAAELIETAPSYISMCDTLEATWQPALQTGQSEAIAIPKDFIQPQTKIPFEDEESSFAISFIQDDAIDNKPISAHKEIFPFSFSPTFPLKKLNTVAASSFPQQMALKDIPVAHVPPSAVQIIPHKTTAKIEETSLLEIIYEQNEVPAVAHLVKKDETSLSGNTLGYLQNAEFKEPQFSEPQFNISIIPFSHFYGDQYPKPVHAKAPAVEVGQTDHTPSRFEAGELNETHRFTKYNLVTLPNLSDLDTVSLEGEFVAKVQVSSKRRDGLYFFSIELEPRNQKCFQPMNQNYTFIIDRSNGIEKNRLKTYCDGVARAIQQLKDDDSFNIILVDNEIEKMSNHSIYKSDLSLRAAKRFLAEQQPGYRHSTPNLSALLLKIGKVAETSPLHNTVFLLSNGKAIDPFAPNDSNVRELIKEYKTFFTLFTATASHGNENAHLQMMSKFFKGTHLHSQTNAAFPRKFAALVKKAGTAVAKNVKVFVAKAPDGVNISFFPSNAHVPDVYTGRNIRLYGQATTLCDFELLVQGQAGNEWVNIRQKIQLKDAVQSPVTFDRELLKSNGYDLFDRYLEENEISYLEQAKEILASEMGML